MEQDTSRPWVGWREIERGTALSTPTLKKLARQQGLPIRKLGGKTILMPAAWGDFVRRIAEAG